VGQGGGGAVIRPPYASRCDLFATDAAKRLNSKPRRVAASVKTRIADKCAPEGAPMYTLTPLHPKPTAGPIGGARGKIDFPPV
jgi:hypothetical protein